MLGLKLIHVSKIGPRKQLIDHIIYGPLGWWMVHWATLDSPAGDTTVLHQATDIEYKSHITCTNAVWQKKHISKYINIVKAKKKSAIQYIHRKKSSYQLSNIYDEKRKL